MTYSHEYHLTGTTDPVQVTVTLVKPKVKPLQVLLSLGIIGGVLVVIGLVIYNRCSLIDCQNNRINLTSELIASGNILKGNETHSEDEDAENPYQKWFRSSLSPSEKDALKKLREKVVDKVMHNYMKTYGYLVRWLRARDWNVEDAEEMLLDHLEWRVEYDIDSVMEANYTFFEREFPAYSDGMDKRGGPVVSMSIEEWDLRKASVGGYQHDLLRYIFRQLEWGVNIAMESQAKGLNISQGMIIINANKYTLAKHACFPCVSIIGRLLFGVDENYPGWLHSIFVINASDLADALIAVMAPYLNGENREAIKVFGFNKNQWQQEILQEVAADQIRPEFGGTKVDLED